MVKLRKGGRESDQKLQGKRDDDEIETTRSLVRLDRDNKIGGANELWVENENENDDTNDLGGTISAARSRRRVWGGARSGL